MNRIRTKASMRRPSARRRPVVGLAAAWLAASACEDEPPPSNPAADRTEPAVHEPIALDSRGAPVRRRIEIPEGSFLSGTEPGRFRRRAASEPALESVRLGPFAIDAFPRPPRGGRGLPQREAAKDCEQRGGRLCTELEWERACKGPDSLPFPMGRELTEPCREGRAECISGFGVAQMTGHREWTSSLDRSGSAVARGAGPESPPWAQRCAHRQLGSPVLATSPWARCCYGPPNAARVMPPEQHRSYETWKMNRNDLRRLLQQDPITRGLADTAKLFPEEAAQVVLARGTSRKKGLLLTTRPLLWSPEPGAQLLVLALSGGGASAVLAFHRIAERSFRLAASFMMQDEPGPVALVYDGAPRQPLRFSTCWGCPGESGRVVYRQDDSVAITQP